MTKFKELSKEKPSITEKEILKSWGGVQNIYKKQQELRKDSDRFVFFDGPATANGNPGIHHMLSKFLKDTFCKYESMNGKNVVRKIGWDTHGLPVEVQVEKELGFEGKDDIEKYGIKEFNEKCRESVWKNEQAFRNLTEEMGQFFELDDAYITYKNDYIETEWWILKKFFDEGLFYEGVKIVPWCPRCGTALASHEVAQGYEEVTANTVIVPFKKKDEDAYFLVWTTTPWTLISNVGLCVNPKEKYVKVESKGYKFILAEALAKATLGDDYKVLETYKGKDLEYAEYEQLIPELKVDKKAFFVTCDEYVTMTDGTGIVHIAPAFGEDDNKVARKYDLPFLNPVGEDGHYTEGPWKGMLIFDADLEVVKYLKENDKLFKSQKMKHDYPHCWRCHSPLVYYSRPSYYLAVTKYQDKTIKANKTINWFPSYVGEKRFGNWLENMNDWAISRNRYWGTPLPLWKCSCGHMEMIGSRKELCEKAVEKVDEKTIDLHRPYVDDIHIKCPECGKEMTRTPEVIDCWFDSGAMPFAQYHYPFENMKTWEEQFPADLICEGIDQTRGWFYSLLQISVFVTGKSPYKNVLVNELILDKYGQKMHKSKGNAVEPFSRIEEYGADTVRFYLPYVSPVWTPLKFDDDGMKEVYSKFFNPLKNTYSFFAMYANIDGVTIEDCSKNFKVAYKDREEIDKWMISKYNKLVKTVREAFDEYDLNKVVRSVSSFVSDDLSNWYIRRNRDRFWGSELNDSKKSVYLTTYEVLLGLSKLIAPITPFVSEEIYRGLTNKESVHLEDYPNYDKKLIDEKIENKMDLVRDLISLGRNAREEVKIKVRQPLSEAILDGKKKSIIGDLDSLIKEELNVKEIVFTKDLSKYMTFEVKPNFKEVGKVFGPAIKEFQAKLLELTSEDINALDSGKTIKMEVGGEEREITKEMVDIRINAKEGFDAAYMNNNFVILNTNLTEELISEGVVRELISKVQQLRKTKNFEITDRINLYYDSEELKKTIENFMDTLKSETLSIDVKEKKLDTEEIDLNGIKAKIDVEKR